MTSAGLRSSPTAFHSGEASKSSLTPSYQISLRLRSLETTLSSSFLLSDTVPPEPPAEMIPSTRKIEFGSKKIEKKNGKILNFRRKKRNNSPERDFISKHDYSPGFGCSQTFFYKIIFSFISFHLCLSSFSPGIFFFFFLYLSLSLSLSPCVVVVVVCACGVVWCGTSENPSVSKRPRVHRHNALKW